MRKQLISVAAAAGLFAASYAEVGAQSNTYKVQAGDSLWKISNTYHLSINQLMEWNQLTSSVIYTGQTLTLANPKQNTTVSGKTYTVKKGDSLWSIATKNGLSVINLKNMNGLKSDMIYPGQTLKLQGSESNPAPPQNNESIYTVKSGDSLWGIASRYKLSVSQLKSLNQLKSDMIYPGQKLTISGSTQTPPSEIVNPSGKVDALINEAKKYIGVAYVWGGSTPAGFDCSGYLNFVFNNIGISIPRTVETIWNATKSVSSPSKGDIVFFETYKAGPSHAGIYLGNNKFIHAGTSNGVTISDMTLDYWDSRYLGAKTAF
ncbi:peptidoglycan DL-endopeptidase LytE [Cytobacillus horneckiae]|uniref:Peptidoglycan endopeptidase n=1 Tax=Cytobacillus horneckiae TaxID=549687 RepID=A0A2N0Z9C7_9BACI|nr:peptidoglycan endopeptidase [Cytobacillus horneckiae]MBN6886570.1 LysM peptidoglycan-binding domain-containing protein [Cytobacillus horneckiae]MCM3177961.1 LysM peptidoglycan-binding domain-containing protein [Cytobacillus horneckiae]MEC1159211.1 LysM peptidoglycan-binding domain-containing protein [Cytobacillus horneckiae]MED2935898.1 LysM peptidoglycan-binding domain-containing protein [Cytobacillus horneckiae]PKG26111.1 peptidoglycan endopeptidase [Cytobacillus horneckiae]